MDSETLLFVVTGVVTLLAIILALVYLKIVKPSKRNVVLITGLVNAGKTVLIEQLKYERFVQTYTSIKFNDVTLNLGSEKSPKNQRVIDVPGHDRVRMGVVNQFADTTKGIIFLVDASRVVNEIIPLAQFLYDLLTHPRLAKVPIIIACNKQDLITATQSSNAKLLLEKEINLLRKTRTAAPVAGAEGNQFLGSETEDFNFSQLRTPVNFADISGKNNSNVNELKSWMLSL